MSGRHLNGSRGARNGHTNGRDNGDAKGGFQSYFDVLHHALLRMPLADIARAMDILYLAHLGDNQVFIAGNGGSASTASHFACDLGKGARVEGKKPLRVIALTDSIPLISAWANDVSYSEVFAEQIVALARPGDVLVAISGSGKSPNVLKAVEAAKERGCSTIGLTGGDGGDLARLAGVGIVIPTQAMTHIEDLHLAVTHLMATELKRRIEGAAADALAPLGVR